MNLLIQAESGAEIRITAVIGIIASPVCNGSSCKTVCKYTGTAKLNRLDQAQE